MSEKSPHQIRISPGTPHYITKFLAVIRECWIMDTFKNRLKAERSRQKLKQQDLASRCGIPYSTYRRYETETGDPPLSVAVKLAEALGVSLDYLTGRTDSPAPGAPPAPPPPNQAEDALRKIRKILDETERS